MKILDNLKTVAGRNGEYVTLESYLNSQKQTQNYTVRVRPDPTGGAVAQTNSPQIRNANVITVQGTPNRIRFPPSNPPNGTIKPRDSPEPKPKPQKKPTAIQLRLDADHLDQTSLLNINGKILCFAIFLTIIFRPFFIHKRFPISVITFPLLSAAIHHQPGRIPC